MQKSALLAGLGMFCLMSTPCSAGVFADHPGDTIAAFFSELTQGEGGIGESYDNARRVALVKNSPFMQGTELTADQVLSSNEYLINGNWSCHKNSQGREIVEYRAIYKNEPFAAGYGGFVPDSPEEIFANAHFNSAMLKFAMNLGLKGINGGNIDDMDLQKLSYLFIGLNPDSCSYKSIGQALDASGFVVRLVVRYSCDDSFENSTMEYCGLAYGNSVQELTAEEISKIAEYVLNKQVIYTRKPLAGDGNREFMDVIRGILDGTINVENSGVSRI